MSEAVYKVKAFDVHGLVEEDFTSQDEAIAFYDEHVNQGDPTYLYKGDQMINSFDPTYDEYCERAAFQSSCVHCGGSSPDGYCWQSPDGSHTMSEG